MYLACKSLVIYDWSYLLLSIKCKMIWTLFLSGVVIISCVAAQELGAPSTSFLPNFVVVGNHATATCRVNDLDSSIHVIRSFTWEHNGTEIQTLSNPGDKFVIHNDTNTATSTLSVNSLTHEDAGVYRCTIEYSLTSAPLNVLSVFSDGTLQVATQLTVSAEPTLEVKQGETAVLRCTVHSHPPPRIEWYRIESGGSETRLVMQSSVDADFGTYEIVNVQVNDAGIYKCRGSYSFDNQEVDIELIVLTSPVFTSTAITRDIFRGSNITIPCSATGNRPPTYSWMFTAEGMSTPVSLSQERIPRVVVNNVTGYLTIYGVSYSDAGNYTCEASNEVGSNTQTSMITVFGSPQITLDDNVRPETTIRVTRGTTAYLDCPFISSPLATLRWLSRVDQQEVQGTRYQIYGNGTLEISDTRGSDAQAYVCVVSNDHGAETQVYNLQVLVIPLPPSNLQVFLQPNDNRGAVLMWTPSPVHSTTESVLQPVEFYVVEQSLNGEEYVQLNNTISSGDTRTVMIQLLPGERHEFRLRAGNMAGLSEPSNTVSHTPPPTRPKLSFFEATPQSDGRTVVVEWILEYDGGPDLTEFSIQVQRDGVPVRSIPVDVPQGQLTVTGLDPDTRYTFTILAANELGENVLVDTENTTSARPSKPANVGITSPAPGSVSISFSVEEGSQFITHFLINITETGNSDPPTQITVALGNSTSVSSREEIIDSERGLLIGYAVVLTVTGLEMTREYMFQVAAVSGLGVGEFSDPTRYILQDERVVYFIIAGIVGGVLLVVTVIVLAVVIAVCRKRYRLGRKIAINGHGSSFRSQPDDTNSDAFMLRSPSSSRRGGSLTKSPPIPISAKNFNEGHFTYPQTSSTADRDGMSSPPYNKLNGFSDPLSSSTPKVTVQKANSVNGTNLDIVVDMLDSNMGIKTDFHSSTKSMPYSIHGDNSPLMSADNRQHACLHTSFNNVSVGGEGEDQHEAQSVASEKQLIVSPPNTHGNNLSISTPVINRFSCDSVLDAIPPSYMTDV